MCPNCNKPSRCGCKSCSTRAKGKMYTLRADIHKGDFVKCPYCRKTFHYDQWYSDSF